MIAPHDSSESAPIVQFPTTDLHVFKVVDDPSDNEHWLYVAASNADALAAYVDDIYGGTLAEFRTEYPNAQCEQLPDEDALTITGYVDPDSEESTTLTLREWAKTHGEGSLCTNVDF